MTLVSIAFLGGNSYDYLIRDMKIKLVMNDDMIKAYKISGSAYNVFGNGSEMDSAFILVFFIQGII